MISNLRVRWSNWLRNLLWGWLKVRAEPEIREWSIDAVRQMYVFWERRIQEESRLLEERKKAVAKLEEEMGRMAAQTTLAVSDIVATIELARQGYDPAAWKKASIMDIGLEEENEDVTTRGESDE